MIDFKKIILSYSIFQKYLGVHGIRPGRSCYADPEKLIPQHCQPPFENIAFQKRVESSNTCGQDRAETYCVQTGASGATQVCHQCDKHSAINHHNSSLLTDFNNINQITWWQSQSMLDGDVQYPESVNLTLHLGKAFEITYVRLRFHSPRPESFAIYKKTCGAESCPWIPYQYYSGSCDSTYPTPDGSPRQRFITHEQEQVALCTSDYSDISPLTGGSVAFSTLLARPSAYQFDKSPVLQDWVTAESLQISLNRINTFGDEIFHDPKVLQSYYYAISDLTIGGRCKCNGHAHECIPDPENNLELSCNCQHNTMGRDCEMCLPLYNDRHWGRATGDSANECKKCECNGLADSCVFDPNELARNGTHGGVCIDCKENTAGPHCEYCKDNYYKNDEGKCVACNCDTLGSVDLQCDINGQCQCKTGVTGQQCNRCLSGYHSMDRNGCQLCSCDEKGSVLNDYGEATCDALTGQCTCKEHVTGQRCNKCKPGYMSLSLTNEYGCYPCFCYSHVDRCEPSNTHYKGNHISYFMSDDEGWTAIDQYENKTDLSWNPVGDNDGVIQLESKSDEMIPKYFVASDTYIGEQRFSYGQILQFDFALDGGLEHQSIEDKKEEESEEGSEMGSGYEPMDSDTFSLDDDLCFHPRESIMNFGKTICTAITGQGNPAPTDIPQRYNFVLHELKGNFFVKDSPEEVVDSFMMMSVLDQLERVTLKGTRTGGQIAELDNFNMETAFLIDKETNYAPDQMANWVEKCETWAQSGYTGQYAQRCAAGFTRKEVDGGAYIECVQCNCNGHSESCNADNGTCDCLHHTTGRTCDRCEDGYYGDATRGFLSNGEYDPVDDCSPCPCPLGATCFQNPLNVTEVKCRNCPEGSFGDRCELCKDTYYGDPVGMHTGATTECQKCFCNSSPSYCDHVSGVCTQCDTTNSAGERCEYCAQDYWGDPTDLDGLGCQYCDCDDYGTVQGTECTKDQGQCECKPHVTGFKCDTCEDGYFNLQSGEGCEPCNCHYLGSINNGICDKFTGQCQCKPGVGGEKCDVCLDTFYGMDENGCKSCNCDPKGSIYGNTTACDESGQCECIEGVIGKKCDKCQENYYMNSFSPYCLPCDECYGLVQTAVNEHRHSLSKIKDLIVTINSTQPVIANDNDEEFRLRLEELTGDAVMLKSAAKTVKLKWQTATNQLEYIEEKVALLTTWTGEIQDNLRTCDDSLQQSDNNHKYSKEILANLEGKLANVDELLIEIQPYVEDAQKSEEVLKDRFQQINVLAQEAMEMSAEHVKTHDDIKKKLNSAISDAQNSITQINKSIELASSLTVKVTALKDRLPQIKSRLDTLSAEAEHALQTTRKAKSRANQILGKTNVIEIEDYNVQQIEVNADTLDKLVGDIRPQIENLEQSYLVKESETSRDLKKVESLYKNAVQWQQEVDKLLAEVLKSKSQVLDSHEYFATAKDMSENYFAQQEEADNLWEVIDEIRNKVSDARKNVKRVSDRLVNLYEISTGAVETARQAKAEVERLTAVSGSNIRKYSLIMEELQSTLQRINQLQENVDNARNTIEARKIAIEEQLLKTNRARNVSQEARHNADRAMAEGTDALKMLRIIQQAIDALPNEVDRLDELDQLEEDSNYIMEKLKSAKIGSRIEELKKKNQEVKSSLDSFMVSTENLVSKRDNLQEVYDRIPDSCPYRGTRSSAFG